MVKKNKHTNEKIKDTTAASKAPSIFSILIPYRTMVVWLILLAIASNVLTLFLPRLISSVIDGFISGTLELPALVIEFSAFSFAIFILTYLQSIVQTYSSEMVGRDMRSRLIAKISHQTYRFIEDKGPSKLLTNLTADIDSIKLFVAQGVVSLVSSGVIIIGAAIILISINWKLGLAVLTIIPLIGGTFFVVLKQVRALFLESRGVIDWLNKVINETILGAALIRVLHSGENEATKFTEANARARDIGLNILKLFSVMIPVITFVANLGTLMVVALGGYFVIGGTMTLGSFAAFNSYIFILIFPILIIGFMSNVIAQASASYTRLYEILEAPDAKAPGTNTQPLSGSFELKNITVMYDEKYALKDASISIKAHTKTAIIGPTAAGKTQLLNAATGLLTPKSGSVEYDGKPLASYEPEAFYKQIGLVFQDSILFNTSVRE
ncbi:MAG: ABC transporter ATP-binding protein, partial [Patescibacteria group bacterium]